jgi:hypothetical protein
MEMRRCSLSWIFGLGFFLAPISALGANLATGTPFQIPFARVGASLAICILIISAVAFLLRATWMNGSAGSLAGLKFGLGKKLGLMQGGFRILETRRLTPTSDVCRLEIDGETLVLVVSQGAILVLYRQKNGASAIGDPLPLNSITTVHDQSNSMEVGRDL